MSSVQKIFRMNMVYLCMYLSGIFCYSVEKY